MDYDSSWIMMQRSKNQSYNENESVIKIKDIFELFHLVAITHEQKVKQIRKERVSREIAPNQVNVQYSLTNLDIVFGSNIHNLSSFSRYNLIDIENDLDNKDLVIMTVLANTKQPKSGPEFLAEHTRPKAKDLSTFTDNDVIQMKVPKNDLWLVVNVE